MACACAVFFFFFFFFFFFSVSFVSCSRRGALPPIFQKKRGISLLKAEGADLLADERNRLGAILGALAEEQLLGPGPDLARLAVSNDRAHGQHHRVTIKDAGLDRSGGEHVTDSRFGRVAFLGATVSVSRVLDDEARAAGLAARGLKRGRAFCRFVVRHFSFFFFLFLVFVARWFWGGAPFFLFLLLFVFRFFFSFSFPFRSIR
jgi:hypothetical protein